MKKLLTTEEMRTVLRRACEAEGSQRAWAVKHKISQPNVSYALKGHRPIYTRTLKSLGYRKVVRYERIKD